ncbi:MAG: radical SAM protein, partial [Sulfolobus sp.]|nr:radical SAM protein [Sulfolobus sp.]
MIPVSVLVTGKGTVSFKIKGEFNREKPSKFSEVFRPVITWNMTYKCNLLCKHCYINASPKGEEGLSTNEALNLVDQMKELKIPLLIMSGGEPLLRKDFFLIAERAST